MFLTVAIAYLADPATRAAQPSTGYRIAINTADSPTLQLLPGVGPSLAEKIITHRQTIGPLTNPDDLMRINGIAHILAGRISPYVDFDNPR